jgi:SsrA-binding protein
MSKRPPTPTPETQKSRKSDPKPAPEATRKMAPRIQNRRAYFDYEILDKLECGIELVGSEVKSVRQGKVQLGQSFARIRNGQVTLLACHIEEYTEANRMNHDPTRNRRLLLHAREIRKLTQRLQKESGATLIPLEIYFQRGFAKVLLGLAKGKKLFDKRAAIKDRDDKRNMDKALRRR